MHHDVQLSMNDCVLRVHTRARGGGAGDGKNTVLLASFPFLLEENTHWPTSCRGYTKAGCSHSCSLRVVSTSWCLADLRMRPVAAQPILQLGLIWNDAKKFSPNHGPEWYATHRLQLPVLAHALKQFSFALKIATFMAMQRNNNGNKRQPRWGGRGGGAWGRGEVCGGHAPVARLASVEAGIAIAMNASSEASLAAGAGPSCLLLPPFHSCCPPFNLCSKGHMLQM